MEDLLQKANNLRKANKLKEALPCYEEAYSDEQYVFNKWDIWGYVHSLKKCGELDKSIELSEKHIEEYPDFENLKNNLVWAYFDKYIRNFEHSRIPQTEHALDRIYEMQGQQEVNETKSIPCPFTIGVFKVLKFYRRPNFNETKTRYWLDKISPDILSHKEQTMDLDGKEKKLASDYESYYSYLTALLFKEKKYEDCIQECEKALSSIETFHYDNNIWFKRKIALSHIEMGELDKAEEILKTIDKGKGEKWFIENELSHIYFEQKDYEKSLDYALKAAKNKGDDLMKVNLFTHMARIFFKLEKHDFAKSHAELVIAIKQANDAKMGAEQQKLIKYFKLDATTQIELRTKQREVERIWDSFLFVGQVKQKGTISKILPNGKSGFIKADDSNNSYYFKFQSVKAPKHIIREGKPVSFYLTKSFDKKKNTETKEAIEIIIPKNNKMAKKKIKINRNE